MNLTDEEKKKQYQHMFERLDGHYCTLNDKLEVVPCTMLQWSKNISDPKFRKKSAIRRSRRAIYAQSVQLKKPIWIDVQICTSFLGLVHTVGAKLTHHSGYPGVFETCIFFHASSHLLDEGILQDKDDLRLKLGKTGMILLSSDVVERYASTAEAIERHQYYYDNLQYELQERFTGLDEFIEPSFKVI